MKKRILCLLLAALMVLAVIPTMAFTALASEEPSAQASSGVGTYGYYAEKGMWYGTGDGYVDTVEEVTDGKVLTPLIAFVDFTHLKNDAATVVTNNGGLKAGDANEDTVRLVLAGNTDGNNYSKYAKTHSYIKIVGGQKAGKFYPIFNAHSVETPIEIDTYGNLKYNTTLTAGTTNDNSTSSEIMLPFRAFDYKDLSMQWRYSLWNDKSNEGNYFHMSIYGSSQIQPATGFSFTDPNDSEKTYTNYNDALYNVFFDDYASPVNGTVFTMEHNVRVHTGYSADNEKLDLFADDSFHLRSKAAGYYFTVSSTPTSFLHNNTSHPLKLTPVFSVTGVLSYDYTNENNVYNSDYAINKGATPIDATASVLVPNENNTGTYFSATATYGITSLAMMQMVPKATVNSQSLFYRAYNVDLTEEMLKQNHLADLMYYYNIDLGNLTYDNFTEAQLDAAVSLNVGLHNDVAEGQEYADTIAALNAMVKSATPKEDVEGNYEYYASRGLWYGTGSEWNEQNVTPLVSFVDLTHFDPTYDTDAKAYNSTEMLENNGSVHTNAHADDVRFVYSPKTKGTYTAYGIMENTATHSYIRIRDGQLAGKFYPISSDRTKENTTESVTDADGYWGDRIIRPDAYGNITYMLSDNVGYTNSSFQIGTVFTNKSFDIKELNTKWRIQSASAFVWAGTSYTDIASYWTYLSDSYNNPNTTQAKYAIETATKIHDFAVNTHTGTGYDSYINVLNSSNAIQFSGQNKTDGCLDRIRYEGTFTLASDFGINFTNSDSNEYVTALSVNSVVFIDYAADDNIEGGGTYDSTNVYREYQTLLNGMYDTSTEGTVAEELGANLAYSASNFLNTIPKSTRASQTLFVRIYNDNLTKEQMQKNHLADLMYYYNIDLGDITAEELEPFYNAAMSLSIGLHQNLDTDGDGVVDIESDENDDYVETVNALKAMVEEAKALKEIDVAAVLASIGFQAKTNNGVGVRALFTVDKTALATLEATYDVAFKGYIAYNGDKLDGYEVAITNYIGDDELENYEVDGTTHKAFAVTTNYVSDDGTQNSIAALNDKALSYVVEMILTSTTGAVKSYTLLAQSKAGTLAAESLTAVSLKQIMDYYSDGTKYAQAEQFKLTSAYEAYNAAVNPAT